MSKAFRLGAFIFGGLLVLAAGIFLIGNKEFLFSSTYTVRADFQNVAGLIDGAEVRVAGLHEGTVKQIILPKRAQDKVVVVMELDSPTRAVVKQDSVASIKSEGLLGDKYVEVSFGSENAPRIQDGGTIESSPPMDISDLIQKTDEILDTAKDTMRNVDTATGNLKDISGKINSGQGTVGELINNKSMYRQANAGVAAFRDDMEALKHNFFLRGFFKKRGYEDSDTLNKYAIAHLPPERPVKEFTYHTQQIFSKPDTAKLRHEKDLNAAGEFLQSTKFALAVIAVSGGLTGETDKTRTYTEAQADAVRDYIAQHYRLDDTRIKTMGLGKATDPDDSRRIEILVYPEANAGVAQKSH